MHMHISSRVRAFPEPCKLPGPLDYRNQINIDFPFTDLLRVLSLSLHPSLSPSRPPSTSFVSAVNNRAHVLIVRHGINHSLIGKSRRANTAGPR